MVILIEGPDGAGKSTLAKSLGERFNAKVVHGGGKTLNVADYMNRSIEFLADCRQKELFICDRTTITSSEIYSPIMDGVHPAPPDVRQRFIADLCGNVSMLIYCRPSISTLRRRLANLEAKSHKSQEYVDLVKERFDRIISSYDVFMDSLKGKVPLCWADTENA